MTEALALFDTDLAPTPSALAEPVARSAAPDRPAPDGARPDRPAPGARRPVLLAVDGNALVHRAFHAYGQTTGGARYGFFALLAVVCDQVSYDGLVVGFDCRERSDRRDRYAEYKAQRPDKDHQLDASLDELPDIASDMGVHVVVAVGCEADDVVASAASVAETEHWDCVVASPDRDVLGLINRHTSVLQVRGGARSIRRVTPAAFERRYRVDPAQYVQLAALRGDSSDNLPGIAGIGAKKAAELLRQYATVEAAVADPLGCRSVLGAELGQALIDDLASDDSIVRRNLALMTLRRDLPVPLEACLPDAHPDDIMRVLQQWRMTGLHARMCAVLCARDEDAPAPGDEDAPAP